MVISDFFSWPTIEMRDDFLMSLVGLKKKNKLILKNLDPTLDLIPFIRFVLL